MMISELRAGWADAIRVFPGRRRMTFRDATRVGTAPYVVGFLAGRAAGVEISADEYLRRHEIRPARVTR